MSRGLGVEQRAILDALQRDPARWWGRTELQQAAWGPRRPDYKLHVPEGEGTHRWIKNVVWWRNGKELTEGNFTRALRSLERRTLLVRSGRSYRLASPEAVADAQRIAESSARIERNWLQAQHEKEEHRRRIEAKWSLKRWARENGLL